MSGGTVVQVVGIWLFALSGAFAAHPIRPMSCRAQEGLPIDGIKFPQRARGLSVCAEYKECTCCNISHSALIQYNLDNFFTSNEVSRACQTVMTMLSCRTCDPEVGVGMKQAICEQTCTDWYRACKDDFFAFTPITQRLQLCDDRQMVCSPLHELASDGRDLCKQAGLKVSKSACFNGRKSSAHGLCSFGDMVEPELSVPFTTQLGLVAFWIVLMASAAYLGPRLWRRLRGCVVVDLDSIRRRQKGIGSNDPETDPYYSSTGESQKLYLD
mmetsp:Transcript_37321/g.62811  ORF Transcript_37321/g.62811 Transcript_37321/m.62811 type:complete len:270 (+) Transcript_37321:282-1091(+)|eukprot:CAMPEP_0198198918 /NCGR_PEP_ID=MMETSP1445-20131203/2280_1 /TAXON_ID=36898 /ORGANISM="Pyramimonas sp., Strain CCMP2087" /LENGTH=269 /DNA_ID=CAMNT_0043868597 /DNA_START=272 /DNA_END=1081 /DNA_ORIENTATION=-